MEPLEDAIEDAIKTATQTARTKALLDAEALVRDTAASLHHALLAERRILIRTAEKIGKLK